MHQIIDSVNGSHSVKDLCSYLGVSRSGYYCYLRRNRVDRDQKIKTQIQAIYKQRKGIYGYRRIQIELERQYGRCVNHKKVLRLMKVLGLRAIIRRKRNSRITAF